MTLTRQQLLRDLYRAYYCARRGKVRKLYVRAWEQSLRANMEQLCDDLYHRRYQPLPSKCFVVDYPKKREIFAAMFRDRIVHHLYFNYCHALFEQTFIQDSYSCIEGRGTHYGIQRATGMLRRESRNWQRPCHALHLDIRGYFMHIVRSRLLDIAVASIRKMSTHKVPKAVLASGSVCCRTTAAHPRWRDALDIGFICWLTEVIVLADPRQDCIICGPPSDWLGLEPAKSMLNQPGGIGLPIGNLTSQLFSNVYLNLLDQFCKRVLRCKCYGRYVDDALIVSADRKWLLSLVPRISEFLKTELGLQLHTGKLQVTEAHQGVEFLGAFIKPWRTYISRRSLERIEEKVSELTAVAASRRCDVRAEARVLRSVNSYLGIFRHTASYRLRRRLFFRREFLRLGVFSADMAKITDKQQYFHQLFKNNKQQ